MVFTRARHRRVKDISLSKTRRSRPRGPQSLPSRLQDGVVYLLLSIHRTSSVAGPYGCNSSDLKGGELSLETRPATALQLLPIESGGPHAARRQVQSTPTTKNARRSTSRQATRSVASQGTRPNAVPGQPSIRCTAVARSQVAAVTVRRKITSRCGRAVARATRSGAENNRSPSPWIINRTSPGLPERTDSSSSHVSIPGSWFTSTEAFVVSCETLPAMQMAPAWYPVCE